MIARQVLVHMMSLGIFTFGLVCVSFLQGVQGWHDMCVGANDLWMRVEEYFASLSDQQN